jgi:Holliday junction resolvase RusA-like endonuclease
MLSAIQDRLRARMEADRLLFHCTTQVTSHISKKNSRSIQINRRTGRIWPGKGPELRSAERHLTLAFRQAMIHAKLPKPISQPIWAIMHFYFTDFYTQPKKKSEQPRMRHTIPDLSNLYELPQDCLQAAGVIVNDVLICSHDLSRRLPSKKGYDYLELFLIDYENGYDRGL